MASRTPMQRTRCLIAENLKKTVLLLRNTTGVTPWMEVSDEVGRACPSCKMPRP